MRRPSPSIGRWAVLVPAALVGVACITLADRPAAAADLIDRARQACGRQAKESGYSIDDVRNADRNGDQRVRLDLRLQRKGESYSARCDYDDSNRRARLNIANDDRRGQGRSSSQGRDNGRIAERARGACRDEARDKGYDIRDIGDADVNGNGARVRLRLERRDQRLDATCRYDDKARRARLDVEDRRDSNNDRNNNRGAGGFFGGRGSDRGDNAKNAREHCIERATGQGGSRLAYTGKVSEDRNNVWRVPVSIYVDNNQRWLECWYDARNQSVELRPAAPF